MRGDQGGCEPSIEVLVKMQKKESRGVMVGGHGRGLGVGSGMEGSGVGYEGLADVTVN